jgi:hypothetical protein
MEEKPMKGKKRDLIEIYSELLDKYEENEKGIADLKAKERDPGEQTILDLFEELQIDMESTLAGLRKRLETENPTFCN